MNWNWIHKRWLVARIELHWACISWCKRRGNHLLEHGKPLNSKRMLRLARKIDRHGMIAAFRDRTTSVQKGRVLRWRRNRWKERSSGHTVRYTKLILLVDAKHHSCPYSPPDPLRMVRTDHILSDTLPHYRQIPLPHQAAGCLFFRSRQSGRHGRPAPKIRSHWNGAFGKTDHLESTLVQEFTCASGNSQSADRHFDVSLPAALLYRPIATRRNEIHLVLIQFSQALIV